MHRKRLIFFDLDGTITDSAPGITKSAAFALKQYGIEVPDLKEITFFVGPPLEYSFAKKYGFSEEKAMQAVSYGFGEVSAMIAEGALGSVDCMKSIARFFTR